MLDSVLEAIRDAGPKNRFFVLWIASALALLSLQAGSQEIRRLPPVIEAASSKDDQVLATGYNKAPEEILLPLQSPCNDCQSSPCNCGNLKEISPKSYTLHASYESTVDLPWNEGELVTLAVRDASISTVLGMIAEQHGLNLITGDQVEGNLSLNLKQVPLRQALDTILTANGYTWNIHQGILVVSSITGDTRLASIAQKKVQVYELDFASAAEIDRVVKGLLSPIGNSFISETSSDDKRKTREVLVVEDLPQYLSRISSYITQADRAPRQVYIEARILEVTLDKELEHGVNLTEVLDIANTQVTFETRGFADPTSSPAVFLGIDGTDLDGLIELLLETTDSKVLASPKVLALNGQQAKLQIGSRFGYFVTTTTETSTLQNVNFLDVGVVMDVTPTISHDGKILLNIKPKVSNGLVNPVTGLPEENTTEVETTVMLEDGNAMVLGGLIQEEDIETQTKVPWLGDLNYVGRLFQTRRVDRKRSEIIVTLIPHIVPVDCEVQMVHDEEISRSQTPIVQGPLKKVDRRMWEPQLNDAVNKPVYLFDRK